MAHVELIPIFENNYVFLIIKNNECVLVDPGEASRALEIIENKKLKLQGLLITHHHDDHIDGIPEIKNKFPAIQVYGPLKNKSQIVEATDFVREGDVVELLDMKFKVMEMAGHTLGHIAYYCEEQNWIFSGDVLFGLGCGRVFEGTFEQAYNSLARFKTLPLKTLVYCTHEYTETNLKFCKTALHMDSADFKKYQEELVHKRSKGLPSVPLLLESEIKTNPFLSAKNVETFSTVRQLRNRF